MHKTEGQRFVPPSRAQLLADLRWILLSEPLLCDALFPTQIQYFSAHERAAIGQWLDRLAQGRAELDASDFEMLTYQRLGRYAEKLFKFFLLNYTNAQAIKPYELVAHNLALNSKLAGGSTQGEIDFLVIENKKTPWHWEMAVKFFACEPASHRLAPDTALSPELIGPNRRDRLSLKIAKLFDRQMRHSAPAPFENIAWQAQAIAKGRIFYRLSEPTPLHSLHEGRPLLNPRHERGFWCLERELAEVANQFPGASLYPLYKSEWLSPKTAETLDWERPVLAGARAGNVDQLPLMVAVIKDNLELTRGFVFSDNHLSS